MSSLKRLAGQTVVYGVSSILQKFISFLLFPYITHQVGKEDFGIYTEMLAYTGLLNIVLTYGLETGFFRFANKYDPGRVFSTAFLSIVSTSSFVIVTFLFFRDYFTDLSGYTDYSLYLLLVVIVIVMDSLLAIPFAKLRFKNRPLRFSIIKLVNVVTTILIALFFLSACPYLIEKYNVGILKSIYNPEFKIGYVFVAYIASGVVSFIMLFPEIIEVRFIFDKKIFKELIYYSFPIMISQIAGFLPDAFDKIMLKHLDSSSDPLKALGVYGANIKFAALVNIAIQMFRYAAEPFFFSESGKDSANKTYADIIKYVSVFGFIIFMFLTFNLPLLKYIIGADFRDSLDVVHILVFSYVLYGIFYSLSVWYKVSDNTHLAFIFTGVGAVITIGANLWFIPLFGYHSSAWIRVATYFAMIVMSYIFSRYYYKIDINVKRILFYFVICFSLYLIGKSIHFDNLSVALIFKNMLILIFVLMIVRVEGLHKIVFKRLLKR